MNNLCECCNKEGSHNILVSDTEGRLYLPNEIAREIGKVRELLLCKSCMRIVEDNFRATIGYLKKENEDK